MDWMASSVRPHSALAQLGRTTNHVSEFVPRLASSGPVSASSGFAGGSYGPYHPLSKSFDDHERPSSGVTPLAQSPSHTSSSPISHDKLNSSVNGSLVVPAYQENVNGTTYFYQYPTGAVSESNGAPPEGIPEAIATVPADTGKTESAVFMSENLKNDILHRHMLTLYQPDSSIHPELPAEVDSYHELCPLEPISNPVLQKPPIGYQASMYKATHMKTGVKYCLRRIHNFRLQHTKFMSAVDVWKKLNHSNIVQLKEVFTTKAFGDHSMVFVYSYHPGSETLLNKHFPIDPPYQDPFLNDKSTPMPYSYQKTNLLRHQQTNKLPEPLIWSYIIQLTSALRLIHTSGLACRSLDPTKIILTSKNRLRLSCLAVMDALVQDNSSAVNHLALISHYQQEDLTSLGKLVLALACKSTVAVQRDNITTALDVVGRTYTMDLRNLIVYLLSNQRRSVTDLMPMIGARFYTQLDNLHQQVDALDNELCKEVQNDRLFRLMTKLATINERPEFNMESSWSETGDRYMLKLFRDYVFHQVTDEGHPWLDMAHIVQCLNKLDAGVPERICLMSRDEQSILVVSYMELKHCLDQSFQELASSSVALQQELEGAAGVDKV